MTLGVFAPPVFPVPHWEEQPKGTGTEQGVCSLNIGFHVENGLMKVERLILINLLIIKGFPTLFFSLDAKLCPVPHHELLWEWLLQDKQDFNRILRLQGYPTAPLCPHKATQNSSREEKTTDTHPLPWVTH